MFSNSNKKRDLKLRKRKVSLLNRDLSTSVEGSLNENNNSKSWLESNNLQLSSSRSSGINNKQSQKDTLGKISDEDILKLTQLTSILPDISTTSSSNQHHHYHSHKNSNTPLRLKSIEQQPSDIDQNSLVKVNTESVRQRSHSHKGESNPYIDNHFNTGPSQEELSEIVIDNESTKSIKEEQVKTYMFDYHSLPDDIKRLLNIYKRHGKLEIRKMTVKYPNCLYNNDTSSSQSDEEGIDKEEDTDPNSVSFNDLLIGNNDKSNDKSNPIRDIAILTTTTSDNADFIKLIQLNSSKENSLLDLHVLMFTDDTQIDTDNQDDFSNMLHSVKAINMFVQESDFHLQDQLQTLQSLNLFEDPDTKHHKLPRTYSQPLFQPYFMTPKDEHVSSSISISSSDSSMSSVSGVLLRPTRDFLSDHRRARSMSDNTQLFKKTKDTFRARQEEMARLVKSLKSELVEFESSLENTEELVSGVQMDMDDFRNRMETHIKGIPESHYSALRKLEVDVESILSKRAKNPWLDTGYALLSYLLVLFVFFFWVIIYASRTIVKLIMLPHSLYLITFSKRNKP